MSTAVETTEHDEESSGRPDRPVVFFDGVCGLCNASVNWLMNRDSDEKLCFAPLQGETADQLLDDKYRDLSSIAFYRDGQVWQKSSAIVRILWTLGQPWGFLGSLLWLIPKPLRNLGYILIAKSRYRMFGKHDSCRMPTESERGRMLN